MYRAALLRSMCGLSWNGLRRKPYVREVLAYRGNPFVRRRSEVGRNEDWSPRRAKGGRFPGRHNTLYNEHQEHPKSVERWVHVTAG